MRGEVKVGKKYLISLLTPNRNSVVHVVKVLNEEKGAYGEKMWNVKSLDNDTELIVRGYELMAYRPWEKFYPTFFDAIITIFVAILTTLTTIYFKS